MSANAISIRQPMTFDYGFADDIVPEGASSTLDDNSVNVS
jgi:hypothetical protein